MAELQTFCRMQGGERHGVSLLFARFQQIEQGDQLRHGDQGFLVRFRFAVHPADEVLHVLPFGFRLARIKTIEQPGLIVDGAQQVMQYLVAGFFLGARLHAVDEIAKCDQVFVLARLQLTRQRGLKGRFEQADVA